MTHQYELMVILTPELDERQVAPNLDKFLKVTDTPLVKFAEGGIVVALALHMALGLRVLAIEFLPMRERTRVAISICLAAAFAVGVLFALNVI